jgi:hypothetical protein
LCVPAVTVVVTVVMRQRLLRPDLHPLFSCLLLLVQCRRTPPTRQHVRVSHATPAGVHNQRKSKPNTRRHTQ